MRSKRRSHHPARRSRQDRDLRRRRQQVQKLLPGPSCAASSASASGVRSKSWRVSRRVSARVSRGPPHGATKAIDQVFGSRWRPPGACCASCLYNAFYVTDHTTHFYILAGPTSSWAPNPTRRSATSSASSTRWASRIGGAVIKLRPTPPRLISMIAASQIHPVMGLPGGVSQAITAEQRDAWCRSRRAGRVRQVHHGAVQRTWCWVNTTTLTSSRATLHHETY